MMHELAEQYEKQIKNVTDWKTAHGTAYKYEDMLTGYKTNAGWWKKDTGIYTRWYYTGGKNMKEVEVLITVKDANVVSSQTIVHGGSAQ